jgi:hypothetical protein
VLPAPSAQPAVPAVPAIRDCSTFGPNFIRNPRNPAVCTRVRGASSRIPLARAVCGPPRRRSRPLHPFRPFRWCATAPSSDRTSLGTRAIRPPASRVRGARPRIPPAPACPPCARPRSARPRSVRHRSARLPPVLGPLCWRRRLRDSFRWSRPDRRARRV